MSKATCLPHREKERDKYVCGICDEADQPDWYFNFLITRRSPEADKRSFNAKRNQDFVLCGKCLDKVLAFIKSLQYDNHYFELRCERLEAQLKTTPSFEIAATQIKEAKLLLIEKEVLRHE